MKKINLLIITLFLLSLSSCFPHKINSTDIDNLPSFWMGTWHGMISAFSFIASLFDNSILVYAVNNNGHWYDFGFVGGLFFMFKMIARLFKSND